MTPREWQKAHPDRVRAIRRKMTLKRYGLAPADYDALSKAQGSVCAICRQAGQGHLSVDHDHGTNAVRGLLCRGCNVMLGYAKDNPAILRNAADYLENHVR